MSSDQAWTIGRLLQWTTDYFKKHGSSSPRLDAEVLLAEANRCQRIELYTTYDQLVDDGSRTRFRELVRRRVAGEPVAYLVGRREFYSLPFTLTRDVLIPRPETELLVMKLLETVKDQYGSGRVEIADVGTGSGVIAICAAKHLASAMITAVDISSAAISVARENAERLGVADRIQFIEGDLLDCLPSTCQFDAVASNPPYVSQAELESLPADISQFEPEMALLAGQTGTEVIHRLIPQAAARLRGGGSLLIEISPMIEQQVLDLVTRDNRLEQAAIAKDLAGRSRLVMAQRSRADQ